MSDTIDNSYKNDKIHLHLSKNMTEKESHKHFTRQEAHEYAFDYLLNTTGIGIDEKTRQSIDTSEASEDIKKTDTRKFRGELVVLCKGCREKIIDALRSAAASIILQVPDNNEGVTPDSFDEFVEGEDEWLTENVESYLFGKEFFLANPLQSREEMEIVLKSYGDAELESFFDFTNACQKVISNQNANNVGIAFAITKGLNEILPESKFTARRAYNRMSEMDAEDFEIVQEESMKLESLYYESRATDLFLNCLIGKSTIIGDEEFLEKHKHLREATEEEST